MSAAEQDEPDSSGAAAAAEVETEALPPTTTTSESSDPELTIDDVFQKDGSNHSAGSLTNGSWGYASVERRLDLNASLDLEKQQGRLKKMLKSIDEGLEPKEGVKTGEEDEKKEMDDSSAMDQSASDLHQSSGELNNKEGGGTGFKVPKTLRSLHKKRDKLRAVVDEFEEGLPKIFHKIEKLSSKIQIQKDGFQERSVSEEYSLPILPEYDNMKSSKKKNKGDTDQISVTSAESEITEKASNKGKNKRTKKLLEEDGPPDEEDLDDDHDEFFDWKQWKKSLRKNKRKNKKLKKRSKAKKVIYYDWKRHRKNRVKTPKIKTKAPPPPPTPVKIPKAQWWVRMSAASALGWKKQ